ncbi:hypothetical protein J4468_03325 [Candidatus Woesearchaeota archaeon]|nr:hypothetical protein [Candidatus Woesearchaeota archaeon]
MVWRKKIDSMLKTHLEVQIKETLKNREALNDAKRPGNAQLWLAIANLSKQLFEMHIKVKVLENAIKDMIAEKKNEPNRDIDPAEELRKILKNR